MSVQSSKRRRVESEDVNPTLAFTSSSSADDSSEELNVQQDAPAAPNVPKHKKPKSSVPAVTDKDLKNLSVMGQYKSNVFKLELDEMLAEVRMSPQKKLAGAEKLLHHLRNLIDGLPGKEGISIADVKKEIKNKGVYVPFPDPPPAEDIRYKFAFAKPAYMNIVGSYATKTIVKHMENITIDLVLTMPEVGTMGTSQNSTVADGEAWTDNFPTERLPELSLFSQAGILSFSDCSWASSR